MAPRTDIHRPVEMDPANYTFIGCFDLDVPVEADLDIADARRFLREHGWTGTRGPGRCDHCGATTVRYFAVLRHDPTGDAIKVGETCLDNRFRLESKAAFDRIRRAAADARAEQRIKTEAREFVAELSLQPGMLDAATALDRDTDLIARFGFDPDGYALRTITDIRSKIWNRYGSAFDSQVALVAKLIAEEPDRKRVQAEREAEVTVPTPEGRAVIEGVVVKAAWKATDFGDSLKLTIKATTDEGVWLGWVSCPSAILGQVEVGTRVRLTATWTRSDDKDHFAFGKRPSKAEVLDA